MHGGIATRITSRTSSSSADPPQTVSPIPRSALPVSDRARVIGPGFRSSRSQHGRPHTPQARPTRAKCPKSGRTRSTPPCKLARSPTSPHPLTIRMLDPYTLRVSTPCLLTSAPLRTSAASTRIFGMLPTAKSAFHLMMVPFLYARFKFSLMTLSHARAFTGKLGCPLPVLAREQC